MAGGAPPGPVLRVHQAVVVQVNLLGERLGTHRALGGGLRGGNTDGTLREPFKVYKLPCRLRSLEVASNERFRRI